MSIAIVLSGGGACGDFEVGAVRYLYEQGVRPRILCGTSVGAINAVKLAEGEGDETDATRGLRGLINIWRSLRGNADMWEDEPWLSGVTHSSVLRLLRATGPEYLGGAALAAGKLSLGAVGWLWTAFDLVKNVVDLDDLVRNLEVVLTAKSRSLCNLNPILRKLEDPANLNLERIAESAGKGLVLRLAAVALESGAVRYVTEKGEVLERDNVTRLMAPMLSVSPSCQSIASKLQEAERERSTLRSELSDAAGTRKVRIVTEIQSLTRQIIQLRSELEVCEVEHPRQPNPLRVSLVSATLASAAIPFVFPPVKLGSENYVDGGVREIAPIEVAVKAGATEIYAILATDAGVDAGRSALGGGLLPSFDAGVANIADVANRAASEIMINEVMLNEVEPPRGWEADVTVIQPDFDIHDTMTIDPGLIDIRMAHGYMRADDTLVAKRANAADYRQLLADLTERRGTALIVRTRLAIWEMEHLANGWLLYYDAHGHPVAVPLATFPNLEAVESVRELKRTLRAMVRQRIRAGGAIPAEVESWWADWERHPWAPLLPLWDDEHPMEVPGPRPRSSASLQASLISLGIP